MMAADELWGESDLLAEVEQVDASTCEASKVTKKSRKAASQKGEAKVPYEWGAWVGWAPQYKTKNFLGLLTEVQFMRFAGRRRRRRR